MRTREITNTMGKKVPIPEEDYLQLEAAAQTYQHITCVPYFRLHDVISFAYMYAKTVIAHATTDTTLNEIAEEAARDEAPETQDDDEPLEEEEEPTNSVNKAQSTPTAPRKRRRRNKSK